MSEKSTPIPLEPADELEEKHKARMKKLASDRRSCPSHCCPIHGCKYDYEDCPVVLRIMVPTYPKNNGCELCELEPALSPAAQADRLKFDLAQARDLLAFFGDEEADVTVQWFDSGRDGPGLYAWCTEYPEEGSVLLGDKPDSEKSHG